MAIAVFPDSSNHANQYKRLPLIEHPDKGVFAFRLNSNSLRLLSDAELEAAEEKAEEDEEAEEED